MSNLDALHARAKALNLHGLLAHWSEAAPAGWVEALIDWEEQERGRRSLERRLGSAHIGRFKPICDFDWTWPKRCDRSAFEALMALDFLKDATNVILVGPTGWANRRSPAISPITPSSTAAPCCSPAPGSCLATSPPSQHRRIICDACCYFTDKERMLEAQQAATAAYLNGGDWRIVSEFVEVESRQGQKRSPLLDKALAAARLHRCPLIVSKVDRLTRSVSFLSRLLDANVDVRFADLPQIEGAIGRACFALSRLHLAPKLDQARSRPPAYRTSEAGPGGRADGGLNPK